MPKDPPERSTSYAKDLDIEEDRLKELARARSLQAEFERARAAQQRSRERAPERMPDKPERSTSYAKSLDVGADRQKEVERARSLQAEFNRDKMARERAKEREQAKAQPKVQDEQRHAPHAQQHLRTNQQPIRAIVDREIDKEKQAKEVERARALNEEARRARESNRETGRDRGHDRDDDRSR
jgi:hypothetical protein